MAKLHLAQEILDIIYPIGSVYISVNTTNPSTLFGGGWTRITGRFLLGADDSTYKNGNTGGASSHTHTTGDCTLTVDQIPSHGHNSINYTPGYDDTTNGKKFNRLLSGSTASTTVKAVQNTGGGKAHNHGKTGSGSNMPPYLVVYMWKRTS